MFYSALCHHYEVNMNCIKPIVLYLLLLACPSLTMAENPKTSLRAVFLEMHMDPEGKQILEQMRIERFVEVSDANYDYIRAMRAFMASNIADLEFAANFSK